MLSKKLIASIIAIIVIVVVATAVAFYIQSLASGGGENLPTPTPSSSSTPTSSSGPSPSAANPSGTPSSSAAPSGSPTASGGAALYAQFCAGCHGNLASSTKQGHTAAQIQTAIQTVGAMSSLSGLTSAQIEAIAAALASPTTTPAPTAAPATGVQLYAQNCEGCHGPLASSAKAGRTAAQITSAIGSVSAMNSLSALTSTQIQAIATALASASSTPTPAPSLAPSAQVYSNGQYRVIAWNDLGMHCDNPAFQDIGVLPPYNTIWAQVIRIGEEPRIVTSGVTVSYMIIDNTYSVGKTDFWSYEDKLFGVNLPDNVGLTGKGLSGTMDATSSGSVNGRVDHFEAAGIPLTEYRDQDAATKTRYPYQLCVVTVTDSTTGALLARTTVTAPVSTEMNCQTCHSDTGIATTKYPIAPTGKIDTNILVLHDYLHNQTPSLMESRPVLCASCHGSNALGAPGRNGVPNLSNSMHSAHANLAQITPDTNGCYSCHPGPETKCLRDVMSTQFGLTCVSCHGGMAQVAANTNPWLNEPRCDSANCHPSSAVRMNNPLFRHSTAMGGIYCEACHGSTHAIAPTTQANDAIQILALQGSNGPLKNCAVCHGSSMGGGNPHIAEDAFPPNALLFVALPFSLSLPVIAFVSYKKKLWRRLDFSVLKSSLARKHNGAG